MKKLSVAIVFTMLLSGAWPAGSKLEEVTCVVEPIIVAHRGASRNAPENTIPAFELAWKQKADAIEGDFRLTKDGHIICIHDADTKKIANTNLVVKDSTLEQLRELDVGSHFSTDYKGTVIPTISEVFSTIPKKKKIYIEVKCGVEIIPKLLEEIKKSGLKREQIVVISFKKEVVRKLKAQSPKLKVILLVSFKRDKIGRVTPSPETVMENLAQTKADGLSSGRDRISRDFIKKVLEDGYEYHVWTVDDLATAKRFKEWGAMSITTNIPGYMKKNLIRKPERSKMK